jgi:hypothetical protein
VWRRLALKLSSIEKYENNWNQTLKDLR